MRLDDRERDGAGIALDPRRVREIVGREVRLKYNPRLTFMYDESIEQGLRMDKLLHDIADEHGDDE